MTQRKAILAVLVLSMAAFSAFSAASASAESRAYTCEPVKEGRQFGDAHCVVAASGGAGFKHSLVTIANTAFVVTNERTASSTTAAAKAILKGTVSGLETEIECTTLSGSGVLTNAASSVSGTGTVKFSGCVVLKPAGRGCKISGGSITTNTLKATTVGQTGVNMKFEPNSGTQFASITFENCLNNKPPNATYPVSGSVVVAGSGATSSTTEEGVTGQATLTFGGNPAGLESSWTTTGSSSGNPLVRT